MKQLSVIVITWNAERYVQACLESVRKALCQIDYELILVDNGSTDNTVSLLQPYIRQTAVQYFPQSVNLGVAKARNIGMKAARGEYIWLLDVDTEVNPESIKAMLEYMENHPECGICGCKLYGADGAEQESCRKYPSFRYKLMNFLATVFQKIHAPQSWRKHLDQCNESQFYHKEMERFEPFSVDYLIGACQLIHREVICRIGWLDEHIFYGPEDADYCRRSAIEGWKTVYLPYVSFFHDYQKITNKRIFSRMTWIHTKALFYFFWKYRNQ